MDNLDENIKGYIESFKDGMIRGWVSVTHNVAKFNGSFEKRTDQTFLSLKSHGRMAT